MDALAHRDDNLRDDRLRNYALADLVHGQGTLDIIEELSFGLDRIVAVMAEAGLPPPVFTDNGDTFVVTLYGAGATLLKGAEEEQLRTPAAQSRRRSLAERQAWVLDHLRTVGPISTRAYAEAMGVSPDTALNDLNALIQRGMVDVQGTTRDRQWVLRREPPPA